MLTRRPPLAEDLRRRVLPFAARASCDPRTPVASPGRCAWRRTPSAQWWICDHPGVTPPAQESPFLLACRRQPVPYTPVWYMRQAGRSLPEYRALRTGMAMLDACSTPDLVTEITLQPVRRYRVDAAIFFSDIVVPLRAIGVGIDIKPGVGPVVDHPVRSAADLAALRPLAPDDVPYITEAITNLTAELGSTQLR
jgi:uroporphyrinogen decarboxylase